MLKYLVGAVVGGAIGFFVLYRLIGCSSGSCSITANPYISTIYGIIIGALVAGLIATPAKVKTEEQPAELQQSLINETSQTVIEYKRITAQQAKARIDSGDDLVILDVRTVGEYKSGHIPDSILISNETITNKKPELLPNLDDEILIYCRSGNRSSQAAKKLIAIGYTNVYDFGGILNWPYEIATKD